MKAELLATVRNAPCVKARVTDLQSSLFDEMFVYVKVTTQHHCQGVGLVAEHRPRLYLPCENGGILRLVRSSSRQRVFGAERLYLVSSREKNANPFFRFGRHLAHTVFAYRRDPLAVRLIFGSQGVVSGGTSPCK